MPARSAMGRVVRHVRRDRMRTPVKSDTLWLRACQALASVFAVASGVLLGVSFFMASTHPVSLPTPTRLEIVDLRLDEGSVGITIAIPHSDRTRVVLQGDPRFVEKSWYDYLPRRVWTTPIDVSGFVVAKGVEPVGTLFMFRIPLLWVWLVSLAVVFLSFRSTIVRHFRVRRGLCGECGYSMCCNTSGTCPECGSPIERLAKSNAARRNDEEPVSPK